MSRNKVIIQGYPGSFHDVACQAYFNLHTNTIVSADSFSMLGKQLIDDRSIDYGIIAIENSIAGSILQNYRILRERNLSIVGEIYLRIEHCLMALPDQKIEDLNEVHSHPMAINQCRIYFQQYPHIKLVDSEDTALSALRIRENGLRGIGAIASKRAAHHYKLNLLEQGIEDNKENYTRFFVIQVAKSLQTEGSKASIWLRLKHEKGSLMEVLKLIADHGINLSKLQSFPVLGELTQYFFHMDLEFENVLSYQACKTEIMNTCLEFKELGIYKGADISAALLKEPISVML